MTAYKNDEKTGYYSAPKNYYLFRFDKNPTIEFKMIYLDHNERYILGYTKNSIMQQFYDIQVYDMQTGVITNLFTDDDIKTIAGKSKADLLKSKKFYSKKIGKIYISQDSGIANNAVIVFDFLLDGIFYKKTSELDRPAINICKKNGFWGYVVPMPEAVTTKYIGFQTFSAGYDKVDPLAIKGGGIVNYGINIHIVNKNKNVNLDNGQCHSLSINNEIAVWVKNYGFASEAKRELCFAYLKAIE